MVLTGILYEVVPSYRIMTDSPSSNSGGQSLDAQSTADASSLDALFDVLANQRRRYTLQCLRESQTPIALADLAGDVATREQGTPLPDIPVKEVKQVYLSLYHVHIPKLVEANIVEYTQERDVVRLATESDHAEPFIEFATANE